MSMGRRRSFWRPIAVGGAVGIECMVSQGCTPIGTPWTITHQPTLTCANANSFIGHGIVDNFQATAASETPYRTGTMTDAALARAGFSNGDTAARPSRSAMT